MSKIEGVDSIRMFRKTDVRNDTLTQNGKIFLKRIVCIFTQMVLKPSPCHKESISIFSFQIGSKMGEEIAFLHVRTDRQTDSCSE